MDKQAIFDAVLVGRVLSSEGVLPRLEAFSGNALYYGRGMPTMDKYKTVKEVCDLTGLTRKHLYYFHHAKVVQAAAYANYSVEGNDGYKLYDDAAVEKLQQIALYYQLGLKRDEIRDIMLDPSYDSNAVLDTLLAIERSKQATVERHIAALEYLKLTGTKNRSLTPLEGMSLKELGETLLTLRKATQQEHGFPLPGEPQADAFTKEFAEQLGSLRQLDPSKPDTPAADRIIGKLLAVSKKYLGPDGVPFVLGFFASTVGLGSTAQALQHKVTPEQAQAVLRYFATHPGLWEERS